MPVCCKQKSKARSSSLVLCLYPAGRRGLRPSGPRFAVAPKAGPNFCQIRASEPIVARLLFDCQIGVGVSIKSRGTLIFDLLCFSYVQLENHHL